MKRPSQVHKAIILPLIGEVWGWLFVMAASFANLLDSAWSYRVSAMSVDLTSEHVHLGNYLLLVAIAGFAWFALSGHRLAIASRAEADENDARSRAAQRFTTLAVVVALAFATIYALGNFIGAFANSSNIAQNVAIRILDVYLPILLATGLVVFVILRAFVFREGEHQDGAKDKRGLTATQRALALGYAMPIIATALAIILGLIVYDATKTSLQVWVWVLIQVIVAGGVIKGTRYAARAKQGKVQPPKQRRVLAAGAAGLNFVLSIVFGAVVSIMAFSFGADAVGKLQQYPEFDANGQALGPTGIAPITATWVIDDLLPALMLLGLAVVGIYWTLIARNFESNVQPSEGVKS